MPRRVRLDLLSQLGQVVAECAEQDDRAMGPYLCGGGRGKFLIWQVAHEQAQEASLEYRRLGLDLYFDRIMYGGGESGPSARAFAEKLGGCEETRNKGREEVTGEIDGG